MAHTRERIQAGFEAGFTSSKVRIVRTLSTESNGFEAI